MKVRVCLLILACVFAFPAFAQVEMGVKKRAKQLNEQNNIRQGVTPAQPKAPAPAPAATPTATAEQQQIARLQTALSTIKSRADATPEAKEKLARDLMAVASPPAKPADAAFTKLAESLATALATAQLAAPQRGQLATSIHTVLNSPTTTPDQVQKSVADVQTVLLGGGAPRPYVTAATSDLKALASELAKPAGQ